MRSMRKIGTTVAALAVAAGVTVVMGAGTASADSVQTFRNGATGDCLDDSAAYDLRTFTCNGLNYQQWTVHVWGDGTRRLENVQTGNCVYDSDEVVMEAACDSSQHESWYVTHWADGGATFENQATGMCLDDSSDYGLRTYPCAPAGVESPYQTWY